MRTEYTIKVTDPKGNTHYSIYPKKYAEEEAKKRLNTWGKQPGYRVEFFKVQYIGNSFYNAEKIF